MTPAALIEQAHHEAMICPMKIRRGRRVLVCGVEVGAELGLARSCREHLDHHIAAAIRADRETIARAAFRAGGAFGAHGGNPMYQEPPDVEATVKQLAEGGA